MTSDFKAIQKCENTLNDNLAQRHFFQKAKPLWTVAYKIRIDQPGQME